MVLGSFLDNRIPERAIKDTDQREDPRFSMHEKRELLDLLNEKARKHHDSVSLVADALGKTAEVKDTCDVSVFLFFLVFIYCFKYYSVYDLVKDVPERDIEDDLTDDTDSDTDDDHDFGDPKVLWENMPPEHKKIVKEMFDTVNKQVEQAKYAEKYNIPLGRNYAHIEGRWK